MANLYKVPEHSPEHSKPEISISLVKGGKDSAIIKINNKVELSLNYMEFKSFDLEGKSYSIQLNNTFIEKLG
jgi:hypothetical protein